MKDFLFRLKIWWNSMGLWSRLRGHGMLALRGQKKRYPVLSSFSGGGSWDTKADMEKSASAIERLKNDFNNNNNKTN